MPNTKWLLINLGSNLAQLKYQIQFILLKVLTKNCKNILFEIFVKIFFGNFVMSIKGFWFSLWEEKGKYLIFYKEKMEIFFFYAFIQVTRK